MRCEEKDWYAAMARPLKQINDLSKLHNCPVVIAGDVFDDGWRERRVPPQLINFAMDHIQGWYGVPGNHDLPHHRYEDVDRSAYWTLVKSGNIRDLKPGNPTCVGEVTFWGWPEGVPVQPCPVASRGSLCVNLAVVHAYIWIKGYSYKDAPDQNRAKHYAKNLEGYHAAAFGDNHQGFSFLLNHDKVQIFNCGTIMRRRSDEVPYKPRVGLLRSSGKITPHYLDVSEDVFFNYEDAVKTISDPAKFIGLLEALSSAAEPIVDFLEMIERALAVEVEDPVRDAVVLCLKGARNK